MKARNIIGLGFVVTLALTAFAIDLPIPKGQGKLVRLVADGKQVAELRILEGKSIELDAKSFSVAKDPKSTNLIYSASGGVTLNVLGRGTSVLSLSAERILVEELKVATPK